VSIWEWFKYEWKVIVSVSETTMNLGSSFPRFSLWTQNESVWWHIWKTFRTWSSGTGWFKILSWMSKKLRKTERMEGPNQKNRNFHAKLKFGIVDWG